MKPMLAHHYRDHKKRFKYPCHVQRKYNGHRCLAFNGTLQTRGEHVWPECMLAEVRQSVWKNAWPNVLFDGELYRHGWSLQQIQSAVKRGTPVAETSEIVFVIFDVVYWDDIRASFADRWERLCSTPAQWGPHVVLAETLQVASEHEAAAHKLRWVNEGYEGLMFRRSDAPYSFVEYSGNKENRSTDLLKWRDRLDAVYPVIGYTDGEGKHEGRIGALICRLPDGTTFNVGTGLSDELRRHLVEVGVRGLSAHVEFAWYSDEGVPVQPTLIEIHGLSPFD